MTFCYKVTKLPGTQAETGGYQLRRWLAGSTAIFFCTYRSTNNNKMLLMEYTKRGADKISSMLGFTYTLNL